MKLKYKVWNSAKKEWFAPIFEASKGNLHDVSLTMSGKIVERTTECAADMRNTFDLIPVLWTGLKDKHGKEVYDGDIIKTGKAKEDRNIKPFIGRVYWFEGQYQWWITDNTNNPSYGIDYDLSFLNDYEDFEIIDNIWESPHLLVAQLQYTYNTSTIRATDIGDIMPTMNLRWSEGRNKLQQQWQYKDSDKTEWRDVEETNFPKDGGGQISKPPQPLW